MTEERPQSLAGPSNAVQAATPQSSFGGETLGPYAPPLQGAPASREISPAGLQATLVFSFFAFLTFVCSGLGTLSLAEYQYDARADYYSTSMAMAYVVCGLFVIGCVAAILAFATRLRRRYAGLAILAFAVMVTLGYLQDTYVVHPKLRKPSDAEGAPPAEPNASEAKTR